MYNAPNNSQKLSGNNCHAEYEIKTLCQVDRIYRQNECGWTDTVLPRSNLTENRGQPRANRGLTAVRPRARRGRHEGGSLAGQPRFARVPPSCRPRAARCY